MAYGEEQLCADAFAVCDWRKDGCIRPLSSYLDIVELDNQNKINQNVINQAVDAFFDGIAKGVKKDDR